MKYYETFEDLKAAVDAVIGIESKVHIDEPFSEHSLSYNSPTGVELLRLHVSTWDRLHVCGFGHHYPPIEKALAEAGEKGKA
jgi:hypothetical protein